MESGSRRIADFAGWQRVLDRARNASAEEIKNAVQQFAEGRVPPLAFFYFHDEFNGPVFIAHSGYSYVGDDWNDQISSIAVVSGYWRVYQHANFNQGYSDNPWVSRVFGPGNYAHVEEVGARNDEISSIELVHA